MSDQSQQIQIDTLRGELREEREVVAALEESKQDAERILNKKILELSERTAERDQLRQQVEKLLGPVENHRLFHVGGGLGAFHAAKRRSDEETRGIEAEMDRNLWDAADQVRKELEGR